MFFFLKLGLESLIFDWTRLSFALVAKCAYIHQHLIGSKRGEEKKNELHDPCNGISFT